MSIKDMAYKMEGNPTSPNVYRLERGKEYSRAGRTVQAIPQFKGLYLYQQAAGGGYAGSPLQIPSAYQVSMSPKRIRIPIAPQPALTTGS
jgi:hypothetical protein